MWFFFAVWEKLGLLYSVLGIIFPYYDKTTQRKLPTKIFFNQSFHSLVHGLWVPLLLSSYAMKQHDGGGYDMYGSVPPNVIEGLLK